MGQEREGKGRERLEIGKEFKGKRKEGREEGEVKLVKST
jgi:hypothetical protein